LRAIAGRFQLTTSTRDRYQRGEAKSEAKRRPCLVGQLIDIQLLLGIDLKNLFLLDLALQA
jgi:hypothetical protein